MGNPDKKVGRKLLIEKPPKNIIYTPRDSVAHNPGTNSVSRWRGVKEVRWNRDLSEPSAWGAILVKAEEVPKLIVDVTRRPIKRTLKFNLSLRR